MAESTEVLPESSAFETPQKTSEALADSKNAMQGEATQLQGKTHDEDSESFLAEYNRRVATLERKITELEEEKKGLITKLQVQVNEVESIKKDKAATENLLQRTEEKHEALKKYNTYARSLNTNERTAREQRITELEGHLREFYGQSGMLADEFHAAVAMWEEQVDGIEEWHEERLANEQQKYNDLKRRYDELKTQILESAKPQQMQDMQITAARKDEASAVVERSLNSRLQVAEAKAAGAEENERSITERLTQTLSQMKVLEAQISCLRAEHAQLTRSLKEEREKAAENRQEYLALKEEANTNESRINQLEEETKELRRKFRKESREALMQQELLQKELDWEKAARHQSSTIPDQSPISGNSTYKLSSASSSMDQSHILESILGSYDNLSEHKSMGEGTMSPYYVKSMTSSTFEAALRQMEGELASYKFRLASVESIRDSLMEEVFTMTVQCEELRAEAAALPGLRAEVEALRQRLSAALELVGEREEELETLGDDILELRRVQRDLANMYR